MVSETEFTVRYAETDQMGIVHHSNYAVWFEAARTDFMKKAGMSYSEIEKSGVLLPLAELNIRYKSSAHYEDVVIVKTKITKLTYVKIFFEYEAVNAWTGQVLATGFTLHAFVDKNMKPLNLLKIRPDLYQLLTGLIGQ